MDSVIRQAIADASLALVDKSNRGNDPWFGLVRLSYAQNIESGVHINYLACDRGGEIAAQPQRRVANVLNGNIAAQGRDAFERTVIILKA